MLVKSCVRSHLCIGQKHYTSLSKAPDSNVFAHGVAFLLGIGVVMGREHLPSFKKAAIPNIGTDPK